MLQSAGAVIAGYLASCACVFLTHVIMGRAVATLPGGLMLLGAGFISAMVGGLVTARVAGRRQQFHGALLTGLMVLLGLISFLLPTVNGEPIWMRIGFIFVSFGAVLGAKLDARSNTTP